MTSLAVEIQEGRANSVRVTTDALIVDLVDGRTLMAPLAWFPRLWHGTPHERNHFEIDANGAYIHWPDLDEDLTVTGLLAGRKSGESLESLSKWLDSRRTSKNEMAARDKQKRKAKPPEAAKPAPPRRHLSLDGEI